VRERKQEQRLILEAIAEPLLEGPQSDAVGLLERGRQLAGEELAKPGANGGPSFCGALALPPHADAA
jgi:hypothetical protein